MAVLVLACAATLPPVPVVAQTGAQTGVQVVRYDMGGDVEQRIRQVEQMRRAGTGVRIEGTCVSACTLYLGLPNACVSATAQLGFHGPRTRIPGLPLPRADFDRESGRIARYYPGPIRSWYMAQGRMVTESYYTLSGTQAAAMGAHLCV